MKILSWSFLLMTTSSQAAFAELSNFSTDENSLKLISQVKNREKSIIQYKPPKDGKKRISTNRGVDSRDCEGAIDNKILLLTPKEHIGYTLKERPTFLFYLSERPTQPVVFSLVIPSSRKTIGVTEIEVASGINAVTLPQEIEGLKPGESYRWSVSIVCDENRRDLDIYTDAWIEREAVSSVVEQQLQATKNNTERARILALGSYWYDALETLYRSPENEDLFAELLETVGISLPQPTTDRIGGLAAGVGSIRSN
ncbi:MAG: DUF928 domain-containing protein [Prochloraceae cyanobacterium]|nr:DUF928 domain-containing protein [Prochloraceae cyanobacterium]